MKTAIQPGTILKLKTAEGEQILRLSDNYTAELLNKNLHVTEIKPPSKFFHPGNYFWFADTSNLIAQLPPQFSPAYLRQCYGQLAEGMPEIETIAEDIKEYQEELKTNRESTPHTFKIFISILYYYEAEDNK